MTTVRVRARFTPTHRLTSDTWAYPTRAQAAGRQPTTSCAKLITGTLVQHVGWRGEIRMYEARPWGEGGASYFLAAGFDRVQPVEPAKQAETSPGVRTIRLVQGGPIRIGVYVLGVKRAIAHPDMEFSRGLTTWWSTTGREIRNQFRHSINDRINEGVPYLLRGRV